MHSGGNSVIRIKTKTAILKVVALKAVDCLFCLFTTLYSFAMGRDDHCAVYGCENTRSRPKEYVVKICFYHPFVFFLYNSWLPLNFMSQEKNISFCFLPLLFSCLNYSVCPPVFHVLSHFLTHCLFRFMVLILVDLVKWKLYELLFPFVGLLK